MNDEKAFAAVVAQETRKQYERHKEHSGTHGGNDAAAMLVMADAVIVSGDKVVSAIHDLMGLLEERNSLIKERFPVEE